MAAATSPTPVGVGVALTALVLAESWDFDESVLTGEGTIASAASATAAAAAAREAHEAFLIGEGLFQYELAQELPLLTPVFEFYTSIGSPLNVDYMSNFAWRKLCVDLGALSASGAKSSHDAGVT